MDLHGAARYFDCLPAVDAYSGASLFTCQMDQYDSTARDSMTGWRRTCSAEKIVLPARRAVAIDGDAYIVGRTVKDWFGSDVIREHALLHPSDGLFTLAPAKEFLVEDPDEPLPTLHGALSLRREQKEEGESSQFFNLYSIFIGLTEPAGRDLIVLDPWGVYYRVQSVETQTGYYRTLFVSELGASALLPVTYYPSSGTYDVETDSSGAEDPIFIKALFERYQSNYRYMTWAAEKYRNGDVVFTVSKADIIAAKNNDRVIVGSENYRVLAVQTDGLGSWELHARAAAFNLTTEDT